MTKRVFVRLLLGDTDGQRQRYGLTQQRFYDEEIDAALAEPQGSVFEAAALLWQATAASPALLSLAFGVRVGDAIGMDRAAERALSISKRLLELAAWRTEPAEPQTWAFDWQSYLDEVMIS